ncbi:MAG TPA: 2,3-epoxybenzoyl-CoA dihydrolase [Myxococcota bacterium]|nr:2,3-epoxybenzoyl-CoA dihydrolase [Myxococcota bacterium]
MAAEARFTPVGSFQTHPDRYRHWRLELDGPVATLTLAIDEGNGLRDDYALKQNSYDLSVDIELHDAIERLRFEHPEVRCLVLTGGLPKVFCAGANIRMLATSTHHFKVNFCKYTNETRCGMEEASRVSGLRTLCALNGTAAGGGYELALSADRIALIDDRSSAVSLPEVPLLGVLPGTGGLTRLVDKRKVRRDIADVFCTKAEGFRARDAVRFGLVDVSFPRSTWAAQVAALAAQMASERPARADHGVRLDPVVSEATPEGRSYRFVRYDLDPVTRSATLTVRGPDAAPPADLRAEGCDLWSLRCFRELDDALLHLRFNHPDVGLLVLRTEGDAARVLSHDDALDAQRGSWFADEVLAHQARVLQRLDNMARSMFAVIDRGSCFAGVLAEVALAADRSYMLQDDDVHLQIGVASDGRMPMAHGLSRLANRFTADPSQADRALAAREPLDGEQALELGLVTFAPDDIDWDDELRIAIEERASLSPDALTGMEQNLRFVGHETCDTRIYGRLSAWQNWIFQRPNAVGEHGALTLYGFPETPRFDWGRT